MRFPRKVYCIRHNVTERVYIGSSFNADRRIASHIGALRRGKHINEDMQSDYDKYGEDYSITILDSIKDITEAEKEYEWMKMYESNVRGKGYNYNDPKNFERVEKKKLSPKEEILDLISKHENPQRAMLIAAQIIIGCILASPTQKGENTR